MILFRTTTPLSYLFLFAFQLLPSLVQLLVLAVSNFFDLPLAVSFAGLLSVGKKKKKEEKKDRISEGQ